MTSIAMPGNAAMEVMDDSSEFFAPVSSDLIDGLLGQYQFMRKKIDEVAGIVTGDLYGGAMHYFVNGNTEHGRSGPSADRLFRSEGAIAALNAAYWSKTLALTDVFDCMPQARRTEWNKSITDMSTPDFTEDAVRPTISGLLASRQQFLSERVDGIFRSLSGEHVTNSPTGFSKRMIIGYMLSYGSIRHERAGLINDLRCVIAKFMGRDEPKYGASHRAMEVMYRRTGEWNSIDGGALRIRVYKKGTAHLEVHPDIAWRLNQILAHMHPLAIPSEFRSRPKKRGKEVQLMARPLPFAVLEVLAGGKSQGNTFSLRYDAKKEGVAYEEALRVLMSIGGVLNRAGGLDFDYPIGAALDEIICSGCLPDQKSHQFYPTPASIAEVAAELAGIGDADTVLEPSAGQGDLARFLPLDRTRCVEISALHCDILRARGFQVVQADFIEWAKTAPKFDRVVMNPPFSEGRAAAHLQAAADLVNAGGRIVAILPASFKGKDVVPGWAAEWSGVYSGEFSGTSVSVVILSGRRPGGNDA